MTLKVIDYTMLNTFLTCRKLYWWRMVRGLVLNRPQTAPEFGRCIHKALDVWYVDRDVKEAIEVFNAEFKENPEDDKRTKEVAAKMLELYDAQYKDQNWKVLATELEFTLPIPETDYALIGRMDKVIDWDGAIYVVDHKTTSRLGAEFFKMGKPNMQFDGYTWAAETLGFKPCSGVVIDALLVAKGLLVAAQRSKLTPVARDISTRSEEDIRRYLRRVPCIVKDIEQCYKSDMWYENTGSCTDYGECPYRMLCMEDESLRDRIVAAEYKVERWEPRKETL